MLVFCFPDHPRPHPVYTGKTRRKCQLIFAYRGYAAKLVPPDPAYRKSLSIDEQYIDIIFQCSGYRFMSQPGGGMQADGLHLMDGNVMLLVLRTDHKPAVMYRECCSFFTDNQLHGKDEGGFTPANLLLMNAMFLHSV